MNTAPYLLPKIRSRALLDAVRDMPCSLRVASFLGLACSHQSTVVPCHIGKLGKGIGTKVSDIHVAAGCHLCHDLVDFRDYRSQVILAKYPTAFVERMMLGVFETQSRWVEMGLLRAE